MPGNLIVTLPTVESTFAEKLIVTNSSNCQPWSLNFALGQPSTLPDYYEQIKRLSLALALDSRGIAVPRYCALYLSELQQQSTFLKTPISDQLSGGLRAVIRLLPPAGSRGYRLCLSQLPPGPSLLPSTAEELLNGHGPGAVSFCAGRVRVPSCSPAAAPCWNARWNILSFGSVRFWAHHAFQFCAAGQDWCMWEKRALKRLSMWFPKSLFTVWIV